MATRKAEKCKVPGCSKAHHARGYCQNCYDELRKTKQKAQQVNNHSTNKMHKSTKNKDEKTKARPVEAEPAVKGSNGRKGAPVASVAQEKQNRLSLIKMRHEAMKREIDQIREDLESDEED